MKNRPDVLYISNGLYYAVTDGQNDREISHAEFLAWKEKNIPIVEEA